MHGFVFLPKFLPNKGARIGKLNRKNPNSRYFEYFVPISSDERIYVTILLSFFFLRWTFIPKTYRFG